MRVLLLITDLLIGGTPTVVRELSWRLREQGVDVQVACLSNWGPTADAIREKGIRVTALDASGPLDVSVFRRLSRLIAAERIDVVLSFLVHANFAATMAKVFGGRFRLIQSIQTTQTYPKWHWWAQRCIQSAASHIVVPSQSVRDVAHTRSGIAPARCVVIPNCIDPSEFAVVHKPAPTVFRVGFIGRLDPVKRIGDLIDALKLLPGNIRLDIWGAGGEESRLRDQIASLGLRDRCQLRGPIAKPQEALSEMDVLVLPSDAEGFGLVLIEAMAAGVPVVGTDVPGIRDVITHGVNGLLVPPRSPQHIADAIATIRADEPRRAMLIEQARHSVVDRFAWPAAIRKYLRIISEGGET